MSIVDVLGVLLPHLAGLRITGVEDRGSTVRIHAETVTKGASCPECGGLSRRVHSRYRRLLSDTAIGVREVLIGLRVRRFVCPVLECPRRIFAERLDSLTSRYGRRTHGASAVLESLGLALGGRAGARLAARVGLGLGRMSLLRLVRGLPVPPVGPLTVVGIDDFAFRRGRTYGTVLVDMVDRRVVDVLDERSAESLAAWLLDHPGIRVACRDRASCYAEGITRGAPDAIQVADRWHLLHNLSKSIVNRLGLDAKTFRRYADAPDLESLLSGGQGTRGSVLDPFKAHLHRRCSEGVTGTGQLLAEIRGQGYRGGERTLRRYLVTIRGRGEIPPAPSPAPLGQGHHLVDHAPRRPAVQ